jgi:23S rRNA (pseudouridine1915-N3)-methyltransferase
MITIVAVGKKHEDWVKDGIERYEKRLRQPFDIRWVLLPHSSLEGTAARQEESERIEKRLAGDAYVVLLDERGVRSDSVKFAALIHDSMVHARNLHIIIGGAYGVDSRITDRADIVLSLSDMVFPHQLVRLMLVEQLYRAQEIVGGGKYHHI